MILFSKNFPCKKESESSIPRRNSLTSYKGTQVEIKEWVISRSFCVYIWILIWDVWWDVHTPHVIREETWKHKVSLRKNIPFSQLLFVVLVVIITSPKWEDTKKEKHGSVLNWTTLMYGRRFILRTFR